MKPANFFLNPQQQQRALDDQYWPKTVDIGTGGDWSTSYLDSRGEPRTIAPPQSQVLVKIVANDDDEITDSNDYYYAVIIDQWFGQGVVDLTANVRLKSGEDLQEGDEVLGLFTGMTVDSPDSADDGFFVVKEILFNTSPVSDHFWAYIIGLARKCDGGFAYRWKPATPIPCCEWDTDSEEGSTPGCTMEVTVIAEGDNDHTAAQWDISFLNGPPTFGVFILRLDSVDYGPFQYNVSAADLQTALPDVAVSLTDFVYSVTSDNYDIRSLSIVFINLEPMSQNLACEINNLELPEVGIQVMMWKGQGGDAKIKIEKTDAVPEADPEADPPIEASGVIWVVTLENTVGGSFTLKMDDYDPTDDSRWDCAASTLETNINEKISPATVTVTADDDGGPFTITVTSDFLDHDLTGNKDNLFGNRTYLFWPDVVSGSGPTNDWTPIFVTDASSPYLASNKQLVLCSTLVDDLVVLLPNDAPTGTQIRVAISEPDLGGGSVSVDPNGLNLQGNPSPITLDRYVVKEFVMGNPAEGSGNWLICG